MYYIGNKNNKKNMKNQVSTKALVKANNYAFFLKARAESFVITFISVILFIFSYRIGYWEPFGFFLSLGGVVLFLLALVLFFQALVISKRDY